MIARLRALLHRHAFRPVYYQWTREDGSYWVDACRCGVAQRRPTPIPANVAAAINREVTP